MTGELWLITGVQAAGKSTVADLLARRFERGAHVRGDVFRRFGVTGWVDAGDPDRPDEARRLLDLRYGLAGHSADGYCSAGFTTVVQDNIYGPDVTHWLAERTAPVRHLVVLRPSITVVEARDAARLATTGKVAYRPDGLTAADLDDHLARTPPVGLWLDTSAQTADEAVDEILFRQAEAVVPAERSTSS